MKNKLKKVIPDKLPSKYIKHIIESIPIGIEAYTCIDSFVVTNDGHIYIDIRGKISFKKDEHIFTICITKIKEDKTETFFQANYNDIISTGHKVILCVVPSTSIYYYPVILIGAPNE